LVAKAVSSLSQPTGRRQRILPWVALALPPSTYIVFEYGLATSLRPACAAVGSWLGPLWGGASLLVCALAAALAWPMARTLSSDPPTRPWIARVATVVSGIFALAIAFQTLATLIVPSCAR
jgi:hypothetical protein